jgi:hypothetical protein
MSQKSAQFSVVCHNQLKQIASLTGQSQAQIIETAISTIHSSMMPYAPKAMETGDFLSYLLSAKCMVKADMVSGCIQVNLQNSAEEEKAILAQRNLEIDEKFKALEGIKKKRKEEFAHNDVE